MNPSWMIKTKSAVLIFFIAICFFVSPSMTVAQQIKPNVIIHVDNLPKMEQEYLQNLDDELTRVIENYNWVERGYSYDLPLHVEIYVTSYSPGSTYKNYNAEALIATRSGIQLRDNKWRFRYSRDFALRLEDPTDPFLSLIEFYTWICLGYEFDRYSPLGGQPFYEKALFIAENAQFDLNYIDGWDRRRDFIRDVTMDKYSEIRTASFHAEAGIFYAKNGKIETSISHLSRAVELMTSREPEEMELHRNNHIIRFIKIQEFVQALEKAGAYEQIEQLEEWDKDHPDRYGN